MKFFIITLLTVFLVGCCTVPIIPIPPETPANINKPCPELPHVPSPLDMGVLLKEYTHLQQQYTECAARSDSQLEINNKAQGK